MTNTFNWISEPLSLLALGLFCISYVFVMFEEITGLKKSKPVLFAAGVIWLLIGVQAKQAGVSEEAHALLMNVLSEYGELFLFLMVAMSYVSIMEDRNIFAALRAWLIKKRFNYKMLFWITGCFAFCLSPIVDNLTTALILCAVIMAVARSKPAFVSLACINIVVAANAGGVFSPFGDITSLMVWQQGKLNFTEFFAIFFPSVINFLIPAICMHFALPQGGPQAIDAKVSLKPGAWGVLFAFVATLITAILFHHMLHLSSAAGMMLGLSYVKLWSFGFERGKSFDIFHQIQKIEWDTMLFFYGVLVAVGGLAALGYLHVLATHLYDTAPLWGLSSATLANTAIGLISAVIDNIPVMYAVLNMDIALSTGQWLLVTLTAGVGGSLLSIGSAAGVALMGAAPGLYTFSSHLKWTWAIALGYFASIATHLYWNAGLF